MFSRLEQSWLICTEVCKKASQCNILFVVESFYREEQQEELWVYNNIKQIIWTNQYLFIIWLINLQTHFLFCWFQSLSADGAAYCTLIKSSDKLSAGLLTVGIKYEITNRKPGTAKIGRRANKCCCLVFFWKCWEIFHRTSLRHIQDVFKVNKNLPFSQTLLLTVFLWGRLLWALCRWPAVVAAPLSLMTSRFCTLSVLLHMKLKHYLVSGPLTILIQNREMCQQVRYRCDLCNYKTGDSIWDSQA